MTPNPYERKTELPNSTATLVLGILSIVFCFCYGFIGLLLGIIALAISSGPKKLYLESPDLYTGYQNLKAGRICAIVGVSLSSIYLVIILIYLIAVGSMISLGSLLNSHHY
ncbi:MAG: hypothetical protein JWO03_2767 [Bacteroidetes bacterium]|nr:hypothetical protein [Bacteroidota bacterium]